MEDSYEYESVLGKSTKSSLFSDDEDAYEAFRQSIINSHRLEYDKTKLHFTGIKIYGYDLYLLKLYTDGKKEQGKKLFYINEEAQGMSKVLAFGYFDYTKKSFCLLANSIIRKTAFTERMLKNTSLKNQLPIFDGNRISKDVVCSASIAACWALGRESDYTAWRNTSRKTLSDTYLFYKDNEAEINDTKALFRQELSLKLDLDEDEIDNNSISKSFIHCRLEDEFYGKYSAEGDYDKNSGSIKVFAGAEFAVEVSSDFRYSEKDYQRRFFINHNCSTKGAKYTLKDDFLFDSIDTATTYIIGREAVGLNEWEETDGKTKLIDYLHQKSQRSIQRSSNNHMYYTTVDNEFVPNDNQIANIISLLQSPIQNVISGLLSSEQ